MMDDICIQVASPADAPAFLVIYAPYVRETDVTFEYEVPTQEEFRGRVEATLRRYPYLKAVRGEEVLGYAYAGALGERMAYGWSATASIYVRRDAHRLGVGKKLYTALEAFLRRQGIVNLYACITYPNPDSIAFHGAMGYRTVAHYDRCGYKFGRWLDVVWMEKELQPHPAAPAPVAAFPVVEELTEMMETFAASGWEKVALPARQWLQGTQNRAAVAAAIEEAGRLCDGCGCSLDPLYRRALSLLK